MAKMTLAMLSADTSSEVVELGTGDVVDTAALQAQVDVQDIEISVDEGGAIDVAIEAGEQAAETLEQTADALDTAAEAGEEVPAAAMEAIRILVAHATKDLGVYTSKVQASLATENFSPRRNNKASLKLATEGLRDMVSKVYESVARALKRVWEWLKGYWNKFFGGAERLEKAYVQLVKKISASSADKIKSDKSWNASSFVEILPKVDEEFGHGKTKNIVTSNVTLDDVIKQFIASSKSFDSYQSNLDVQVKDKVAATKSKGQKDSTKKVESGCFFGTKVSIGEEKTSNGNTVNLFDITRVGSDAVASDVKIEVAKDEAVSSLMAGAKAGLDLAKILVARKARSAEFDKALSDLVKEMEAAAKAKPGTGGEEEKKAQQEASDLSKTLRSLVPAVERAGLVGAQRVYSLLASAVSSTKAAE